MPPPKLLNWDQCVCSAQAETPSNLKWHRAHFINYMFRSLKYIFTYIATSKRETMMPRSKKKRKHLYTTDGAFTAQNEKRKEKKKVNRRPRWRVCRRRSVSQQLLSCKYTSICGLPQMLMDLLCFHLQAILVLEPTGCFHFDCPENFKRLVVRTIRSWAHNVPHSTDIQ